jgi:hypothetical protein
VGYGALMTAAKLKNYANKEIDLRGERSCDDMLRWLENLTKARGSIASHMISDKSLVLPEAAPLYSKETDPLPDGKTMKSDSNNNNNNNNVIKNNNNNDEFWKTEEDDDGMNDVDENGQPMVVTLAHGAAEKAALKSLRRKDSFTVPLLQNTPQGSSMDEEGHGNNNHHQSNDKVNSKEKEEDVGGGGGGGGGGKHVVHQQNQPQPTFKEEDRESPSTIRAATAEPKATSSGGGGGGGVALVVEEFPMPPSSSSNNSVASQRAAKLSKAASAARTHYLRTAVDPVFVPLLDAVVLHKPRLKKKKKKKIPYQPILIDWFVPDIFVQCIYTMFNFNRDVTTFVAEHCLKQLVERGTEAEKEVVRAMMKRILDS